MIEALKDVPEMPRWVMLVSEVQSLTFGAKRLGERSMDSERKEGD